MPTTRPDTFFDETGECSACVAYRKRPATDWDGRAAALKEILASAKPNADGFTCVVPSSGGKDSHYQVLQLIELGAKPLVVTASTCCLSPIGRANIDNLSRLATTIEVTPNRWVRAKLNRIGLRMLGDISYPEHLSIFSIPFKVAVAMGIPLMFYGEAPLREYGGPPGSEDQQTMTRRWVSEHGGLLGLRTTDVVGMDGITASDMEDYTLPPDEKLRSVTAYFLGQFLPWSSHFNAQVAQAHGMQQALPTPANWWDAENLDCVFTSFHDHFCALKYGFGRAAAQLSVDIRYGLMTRARALEIVAERDGKLFDEYAGVNIWDALASIDISKAEYFDIAARFTSAECSRAA